MRASVCVCGGIQQASMLWETAKIKIALLTFNAPPAFRLVAMFTKISAGFSGRFQRVINYWNDLLFSGVRARSLHSRFGLVVLLTQVKGLQVSNIMSLAAFGGVGVPIAAASLPSVLCFADKGNAQTTESGFPVGPEHLDNTIETDHLSLSSVRACGRNNDWSLAFSPALACCTVGRQESSAVVFFWNHQMPFCPWTDGNHTTKSTRMFPLSAPRAKILTGHPRLRNELAC